MADEKIYSNSAYFQPGSPKKSSEVITPSDIPKPRHMPVFDPPAAESECVPDGYIKKPLKSTASSELLSDLQKDDLFLLLLLLIFLEDERESDIMVLMALLLFSEQK